ncbi:asparaginase [Nocardia sp. CNY236]|uniref:asparaginase n=1 Tax=Nocardia sp. CNY236 TaxID=1169152 RepID=UPI000422C9A4|nr:asparaginase [Nocardia sp. CNY236]
MARILLIATGDTIAYQQYSPRPAVASGERLLAAAGIDSLPVDVHAEDIMAEPSWDTSPTTMLALARRTRSAVLDDGYDAVVLTHGVDTLEETAFLTDLMAGPDAHGSIVFTGALHCLDAPGSDGPDNLSAALAAAHPATRNLGALVCFHRELHAARWARLVDASGPPAFSSAPYAPLGHVSPAGEVSLTAAAPIRPPQLDGAPESDVALIKTYPGMTPALLTAAVDAGARGIVLEGTGAGNVPVELFTTIDELTSWNIPVVLASRARYHPAGGGNAANANELATKLGAIPARGLSPAHARIALMVALASGEVDAVRHWFNRL